MATRGSRSNVFAALIGILSLSITSLGHAQISSSREWSDILLPRTDTSSTSELSLNPSGLSSEQIGKIAADAKVLFADFGIEVDLPRLEHFLSQESRTFPLLVRLSSPPTSGRQYGRYGSSEKPCELVFPEPGVISRVSSMELREINPQGNPKEWVQKLDKLQCMECKAALAAKFDVAGIQGMDAMRREFLLLMLPKEFQMIEPNPQ